MSALAGDTLPPHATNGKHPERPGVRALDPLALVGTLRETIAGVYFGNPGAVDRLLACMLARGHCLIEDVPGVGKTLLAGALARCVDCSFSRLQLTPDLLPADVLGSSVYRRETGAFEFRPGPIFANVVLADEVNRATPRTQSAMLEAMNDATVTVDGVTHALPKPFMLVATQNPASFEGTFPLPENQLDRFLIRLALGYPAPEDEARVLALRPSMLSVGQLPRVIDGARVIELQQAVDAVKLDATLVDYIIAIAGATRAHEALALGLSPRGAMALAQMARATALVRGRDYVVPEDIADNVGPVVAHRVLPAADIAGDSREVERVVQSIARSVPSPV